MFDPLFTISGAPVISRGTTPFDAYACFFGLRNRNARAATMITAVETAQITLR